jgi:hypothetical protein
VIHGLISEFHSFLFIFKKANINKSFKEKAKQALGVRFADIVQNLIK